MRGLEQNCMGRGHSTNRRTCQLSDQLGPEGRVGENKGSHFLSIFSTFQENIKYSSVEVSIGSHLHQESSVQSAFPGQTNHWLPFLCLLVHWDLSLESPPGRVIPPVNPAISSPAPSQLLPVLCLLERGFFPFKKYLNGGLTFVNMRTKKSHIRAKLGLLVCACVILEYRFYTVYTVNSKSYLKVQEVPKGQRGS